MDSELSGMDATSGLPHKTHLLKMVVKGEGFLDVQLFHHRVRGAIRKGPLFVDIELGKDLPCLVAKDLGNLHNVEDVGPSQLVNAVVESHRPLIAEVQQ